MTKNDKVTHKQTCGPASVIGTRATKYIKVIYTSLSNKEYNI